jgi:hypothetical protein
LDGGKKPKKRESVSLNYRLPALRAGSILFNYRGKRVILWSLSKRGRNRYGNKRHSDSSASPPANLLDIVDDCLPHFLSFFSKVYSPLPYRHFTSGSSPTIVFDGFDQKELLVGAIGFGR